MFISIEKKEFSEAVHIAGRFAERKSATLPALSAILVVAGNDGIKLRATNLETGVDLTLKGDVTSEGVVAIPATVLQQVAASLTRNGKVTIEHAGEVAVIESGASKSSLKTVPYADFPSIPVPEQPENTITLSGALLKGLFGSIASCASASTVRPELASISITVEGGVLTAVATDSFRLAEKKVPIANKGAQGVFLIPAKNALDIASALPDTDIELSFDEHQAAFKSAGGLLVSRLTNATYPDYRQIIPKEFSAEATLLRKDFDAALKRTAIFSDTFQKVRVAFDIKKSSVAFSARNADVGESVEALMARVSGTPLELSFNHRYLSAVLGLTNADSLTLSASGVGRPLIIKGAGDASLLYLVSPMNQ